MIKLKTLIKEQNKKSRDLDELLKFYESCKNTIKIIESEIKDPGKKVTELNELLAEQRFISKQLDERNKITFLEKCNAIVANISCLILLKSIILYFLL